MNVNIQATPPSRSFLSSSNDSILVVSNNLRTSTSKLVKSQKIVRESRGLEVYFKECSDALNVLVFGKMALEDIVKFSMVSKWTNAWMHANKPMVVTTEKKVKSFEMIKGWISKRLVKFRCMNVMLTNEDLKEFPITLQELELGLDQKITNEAMKNLPKNLKKLRFLYGIHIANSGLKNLPSQLTHLTLEYNNSITDIGLKALPSTLVYLNLLGNKNITDVGIMNLPRNLEYLNLHENMNITNNGLKYLPPTIKTLDLHNNNNITDEGIKLLPKTITHLDLHNTRLITVEGMKTLSIEKMRYLDLFFNKKIPRHFLKTIPGNLKHLSFGCAKVK